MRIFLALAKKKEPDLNERDRLNGTTVLTGPKTDGGTGIQKFGCVRAEMNWNIT